MTRQKAKSLLICTLASLAISLVRAFSFLPGIMKPKTYKKGDQLFFMTSMVEDEHQSMSFELFDLGLCQPEPRTYPSELLQHEKTYGETFAHEYQHFTPYSIWLNHMDQPECEVACSHVKLAPALIHRLKVAAQQKMTYRLSVDNLPSATIRRQKASADQINFSNEQEPQISLKDRDFNTNSEAFGDEILPNDDMQIEYDHGIPIARFASPDDDPETVLMYNHLELIVELHEVGDNKYRIVGFEVEPLSKDWGQNEPCSVKRKYFNLLPPKIYQIGEDISYTYQIRFKHSQTTWGHRLDHYLKLGNDKIHHAQMLIGLLIALVMTCLVKMILNRTLNEDFNRIRRNSEANRQRKDRRRDQIYNTLSTQDSSSDTAISNETSQIKQTQSTLKALETVNWTKLQSDVFRSPNYLMVFTSLIGVGVQATLLVLTCLICALIGMQVEPLKRDYLFTAFFVFSAGFGNFNGYFASKLYKSLNGTEWLVHALINSLFLPFFAALLVSLLDIEQIMDRVKIDAMSYFHTQLPGVINEVFALWLVFDIPGTLLGYYLGLRSPKMRWASKPSRFVRQVPIGEPWYARPLLTLFVGSAIIAATTIAETYYLVTSLWRSQLYLMYFYLALSLGAMCYVASAVSIVQTYLHLVSGNYKWWWNSFLLGLSTSGWLLVFTAKRAFFIEKEFTVHERFSFVVHGVLICVTIGFVAGCCSFFASLRFVNTIYAQAQQSKVK